MASNEQAIDVRQPIDKVFAEWIRFETFPRFMLGVHDVTPIDQTRLRWRADIGGRQREWETDIIEQTPDTRLAWSSVDEPTYTYTVTLEPIGGSPETRVKILVEYDSAATEQVVGDAPGGVAGRISSDLHRFKSFVEGHPPETSDVIPGEEERGSSIGRESRIDDESIGTVRRDGQPQVVIAGNMSGLTGDTINGLGGAPDRGVDNGMNEVGDEVMQGRRDDKDDS